MRKCFISCLLFLTCSLGVLLFPGLFSSTTPTPTSGPSNWSVGKTSFPYNPIAANMVNGQLIVVSSSSSRPNQKSPGPDQTQISVLEGSTWVKLLSFNQISTSAVICSQGNIVCALLNQKTYAGGANIINVVDLATLSIDTTPLEGCLSVSTFVKQIDKERYLLLGERSTNIFDIGTHE
jgi:hypothetical protein